MRVFVVIDTRTGIPVAVYEYATAANHYVWSRTGYTGVGNPEYFKIYEREVV